MNIFLIFSTFAYLFVKVNTFSVTSIKENGDLTLHDTFGTKTDHLKADSQAKRDISLSYSATNIDSKEGTRVKTITVIKNHNGKTSDKLAINPELHKNEEWATAFRDNFDTYGPIPDVPDIDDLFEFVNKKKSKVEGKGEEKNKNDKPKAKDPPKEVEKPVVEPSSEVETGTAPASDGGVEKIKGDAELIPNSSKKASSNKARSQSLSSENIKKRAPLLQQYFDKYIQENPKINGYDYPKPCQQATKTSIINISGRTYDIPAANNSNTNPYLAPAVTKKSQVQPTPASNNNLNTQGPTNRPNFSINSILPSIQPTPGSVASRISSPAPSASQSTTQRPYVAPSLRNGNNFAVNRVLPPVGSTYRSTGMNFRINAFGFSANRPITARSRGLKY